MDIKIGMVAPTKAGKTSILSAILSEVKERLSGNTQNIQYCPADEATSNAIKRALSTFAACTAGGDGKVFETPQMQGSQSILNYKFEFSIPVETAIEKIAIEILDYPGGLLGQSDYNAKVLPFLNECCALIVPIPADLLMELASVFGQENPHAIKTSVRAQEMLDIGNVVSTVKDWMTRKNRNAPGDHVLVSFVPIRCENCFNDNGGNFDKSDLLFEAVQKFYVEPLGDPKGYGDKLHTEILAVDTYGIVELRDVVLSRDGKELVSTFLRRTWMKNRVQPKCAFELLVDILRLQLKNQAEKLGMACKELQRRINERSFLADILALIFGDSEKKKIVANIQMEHGAYQAIDALDQLYEKSETRLCLEPLRDGRVVR